MSAFINKDMKKMLSKLRALGVEIDERSNGKHNKFRFTLNGQSFIWVCAKTTSDHRAQLNQITGLRRMLKEKGMSDEQAHEVRFG
jgi:hypothetical protein